MASTKPQGLQVNYANTTSELTEEAVGQCFKKKKNFSKIKQSVILTVLLFSPVEENIGHQIR